VDRIFISYRRDDTGGYASQLYDDLLRAFRGQVFQDVHRVEPADRYRERIAAALARCTVALVVIGPNWLRGGRDGGNRLDDPDDLLRFEIVTVLARSDVTVFPVLVGGAALPSRDELPEDVQPLLERTVYRIDSGPQRKAQVEFLAGVIGRRLDVRSALPAALAALVLVAAIAAPVRDLSLAVKHAWPTPLADPSSSSAGALAWLGALHAIEWALFAGCAAAAAALVARGTGAAVRAFALGALLGTLAGLAGGALEQWLRAQEHWDTGSLAGATVAATIAALSGLAGKRSAASVAAAGLGALTGSLIVWHHHGGWPFVVQVVCAMAGVAAVRLASLERRAVAPARRLVRV
jgi:TIR domain